MVVHKGVYAIVLRSTVVSVILDLSRIKEKTVEVNFNNYISVTVFPFYCLLTFYLFLISILLAIHK